MGTWMEWVQRRRDRRQDMLQPFPGEYLLRKPRCLFPHFFFMWFRSFFPLQVV